MQWMRLDPVLDRLEAAFDKHRAELLATDEGRWALFVQPNDKRFRPRLLGCFDDEFGACDAGYRNTIGRRFLVREVLERDRVVSIPWAVSVNRQ